MLAEVPLNTDVCECVDIMCKYHMVVRQGNGFLP